MRSSTVKANVLRRPLIAAGRICRRLYSRTPPFLRYLLVKSRKISTISSTIDGLQSPHRCGTIRSRQHLPQWESYSICRPHTGVPRRRRRTSTQTTVSARFLGPTAQSGSYFGAVQSSLLTPRGAKVNGWVPGSGSSRPNEHIFERDERKREKIELRERELEYALHKQHQMHYTV
jgi:hypothetical protein